MTTGRRVLLIFLALATISPAAVTTVIYPGTTTITCTLASLANSTGGSAHSCPMTNNTSNNDIEAHLYLKFKTGTGTASGGSVNILGYACVNADTSRCTGDGAVVGTDVNITIPTTGTALPLLAGGPPNCFANVDAKVYVCGPYSIAQTWGGTMPAGWGIVVQNLSGAAFDATAGNFGVFFDRIRLQNAFCPNPTYKFGDPMDIIKSREILT